MVWKTERYNRIIPAYAGSTASLRFDLCWDWDHPRIRGEHDFDLDAIVDDMGSSPHTRGARPGAGSLLLGRGIIPAYAGSTNRRLRRLS